MASQPQQSVKGIIVVPGQVDQNVWGTSKVSTTPILLPAPKQRVLIMGWPGSAKSSACASIPNCLHIDTERSAEHMPMLHPSSARVSVSTWEEYEDVIERLKQDAEINGPARRFQTVAIDTVDGLGGNQLSIAAERVMRDSKSDVVSQFGANGAGWAALAEYCCRIGIHSIEEAGYGWVLTTHIRRKQITTEGGPTFQEICRDLTARVDQWTHNRATIACIMERRVDAEEEMKQVVVDGKTLSSPTGKMIEKSRFFCTFHSTMRGAEKLCKARIMPAEEFEFTGKGWWSEFEARFEKARQSIMKKIGMTANG